MTRIVITGLGAITPIGNDVEKFWENMKAGVSGADYVKCFDVTDFPVRIACEVKDFDPREWMDRKMIKRMARSTHFSIATAKQALADAKFEITPENSSRVGVVFNTGGGGMSIMEEGERHLQASGPRAISPFLVPSFD
jgi:3-oxoacyl-[acyl-carrier-protein] synthase II